MKSVIISDEHANYLYEKSFERQLEKFYDAQVEKFLEEERQKNYLRIGE